MEQSIEYIKDHLEPMDVIEGLGLDFSHENGQWLMCHCPFKYNHANGDQSASFGFNSETLNYNCFVCGGGSLLNLVMSQLDLNISAAIQWLQNITSIEPSSEEKLVAKVNKIMHPPADKEAAMPEMSMANYLFKHYKSAYISGIEKACAKRGINKSTIDMFHVGYDIDHYGITIPHVFEGKLRGWQTRHLLSENGKFYCDYCGHNKSVPKYTNTPNFPKLNTLFLYDYVVGKDVTVVESPLSALYLWSLGVTNAVATFGSFSLEQAELLKKFTKVRIWPDNDAAGAKNLYRVLDDLRKATEVVIVPLVDTPHGDAGDVPAVDMFKYLFAAYPPTILPLFKQGLPTLDQVKTVL